ncbi:hypothetical protein DY000_02001771 [Brassica cretica]|uniref:Uncharacterized protein n=1 Tax=Brassica cretica TaxID=69181 RepID=A0ABQ7C456_BRACR|nr:hypothetical protein DY000_02001771 [Brassica cretica]
MEQCELEFWSLVMYDGKRLVLREKKKNLEGVTYFCKLKPGRVKVSQTSVSLNPRCPLSRKMK